MASKFDDESVSAAVDRSIRAADHLRARDAAAVAAVRALARKIDEWDIIAKWAAEDVSGEGRPRVPAHDNVSLGTFLKYLEQLQLVPPAADPAAKPAAAGVTSSLDAWRKARGSSQAS